MSASSTGWRLLARKELGDAHRNRQLYTFAGTFLLAFGLIGYLFTSANTEPTSFLEVCWLVATFLVPLTGLMLGHETIVRKRERGQLKLLVGLPNARGGVVLGAIVGEFAILAISTTVGTVTVATVAAARGVVVPAPDVLAFLGLLFVLGAVYVAIGVAISAIARSTTIASIVAFSTFLVFLVAWPFVPDGLAYLVNGLESPATSPAWTPYVDALSPNVAVSHLYDVIVGGASIDRPVQFSGAVIVGWAVLAPVVGALRFARTDL